MSATWLVATEGYPCATASSSPAVRRHTFELSELADQTGWDGVFVWEAASGSTPGRCWGPWRSARRGSAGDDADAAAVAAAVEAGEPGGHARPAFRGRAILAVGLGAVENALGNTGEELDRRARADMLDEGIDLIRSFWEGRLGTRAPVPDGSVREDRPGRGRWAGAGALRSGLSRLAKAEVDAAGVALRRILAECHGRREHPEDDAG